MRNIRQLFPLGRIPKPLTPPSVNLRTNRISLNTSGYFLFVVTRNDLDCRQCGGIMSPDSLDYVLL